MCSSPPPLGSKLYWALLTKILDPHLGTGSLELWTKGQGHVELYVSPIPKKEPPTTREAFINVWAEMVVSAPCFLVSVVQKVIKSQGSDVNHPGPSGRGVPQCNYGSDALVLIIDHFSLFVSTFFIQRWHTQIQDSDQGSPDSRIRSLKPNPHRARDATRPQIRTFFL